MTKPIIFKPLNPETVITLKQIGEEIARQDEEKAYHDKCISIMVERVEKMVKEAEEKAAKEKAEKEAAEKEAAEKEAAEKAAKAKAEKAIEEKKNNVNFTIKLLRILNKLWESFDEAIQVIKKGGATRADLLLLFFDLRGIFVKNIEGLKINENQIFNLIYILQKKFMKNKSQDDKNWFLFEMIKFMFLKEDLHLYINFLNAAFVCLPDKYQEILLREIKNGSYRYEISPENIKICIQMMKYFVNIDQDEIELFIFQEEEKKQRGAIKRKMADYSESDQFAINQVKTKKIRIERANRSYL